MMGHNPMTPTAARATYQAALQAADDWYDEALRSAKSWTAINRLEIARVKRSAAAYVVYKRACEAFAAYIAAHGDDEEIA